MSINTYIFGQERLSGSVLSQRTRKGGAKILFTQLENMKCDDELKCPQEKHFQEVNLLTIIEPPTGNNAVFTPRPVKQNPHISVHQHGQNLCLYQMNLFFICVCLFLTKVLSELSQQQLLWVFE